MKSDAPRQNQPEGEQRDIALNRARLEGAQLTAREVAVRLSADLAVAVGNLILLQEHSGFPTSLRPFVLSALASLEAIGEDVKQFQQLTRVETKETLFGPTLDLERSTQPPEEE